MTTIPNRSRGRRRDRHGRGLRGPVLPPGSPGALSRAQKFDEILAWELGEFSRHIGKKFERYDFAVLDVPASDPAPWEHGVPLTRYLPFERPSKIHGRFIFYRKPIEAAAEREDDPRLFIHDVLVNQIADALKMNPYDVDFAR